MIGGSGFMANTFKSVGIIKDAEDSGKFLFRLRIEAKQLTYNQIPLGPLMQ